MGKARRFVARLVADLPGELRDAVRLMVSELATNALVHASSAFDVAVDRSDNAVTVSVTDRGAGTLAMQSPTSSEPHGRGLQIVEALSDAWGTSSSVDGKTVWFTMSLRNRSTGHQEDQVTADMVAGGDDQQGRPDYGRGSVPASRPALPDTGLRDRPRARRHSPRRRWRTTPAMCRRRLVASAPPCAASPSSSLPGPR